MSSAEEQVRDFVRENRSLVTDVLRFSQDPYARACALVLLKRGGTQRDVIAIKEDLDSTQAEPEE